MSIKELEEYLLETLEMELLDETKQTVQEVIDSAETDLELDDSMHEVLKYLKKYKNRYCYYAVDMVSCTFGQGFVITDAENNYLGFIRTI